MATLPLLVLYALTPQRAWLDHLALLVPSSTVTRWLLVADLACLVALGARSARPAVGIPVAVGAGFLALNVLGLLLTEFFLALAAFHVIVGTATAVFAGGWRWLGGTTVLLAVGAGVLT